MFTTPRSLATLGLIVGLSLPAAADDLGILVPAYFYPSPSSQLWPAMNEAASRVPLVAIMNPNSGPSNFIDSNYTRVVDELRAAGGTVIAYVATTYSAKPLSQVFAEVDLFASQYNLDGIFLDEMSNTPDTATLDHYQAIYDHIKSVDQDWLVMGNPGIFTQEQYITRPTADNIVVFESFASNYPSYTPDAWNFEQPRSAISHLVHTEPSEAAMLAHVEQAIEQNVGLTYVTHDVLGNPWDTLPIYWDSFVQAVETANVGLIEGDYDLNGTLDANDLQLIFDNPGVPRYDADNSGTTDENDAIDWSESILGTRLGDANLDQSVDLIDLSILASNFFELAGYTAGDFNLSGAVNLVDLSILATNFGYTATNLPEPAASATLGMLAAVASRRRKSALN